MTAGVKCGQKALKFTTLLRGERARFPNKRVTVNKTSISYDRPLSLSNGIDCVRSRVYKWN